MTRVSRKRTNVLKQADAQSKQRRVSVKAHAGFHFRNLRLSFVFFYFPNLVNMPAKTSNSPHPRG